MKILFVTSRFPYPPFKGDKVRAFFPIRELTTRHTIDLLSFAEEKVALGDREVMSRYCRRIGIVRLPKASFFLRLALGVFSSIPSQVFCYSSCEMRRTLQQWIQSGGYDLIYLVCGRILGIRNAIRGVPVLLDWIDALSLSTRRMHETERCWPKKWLYWWEWKKMAAFERRSLHACDYMIVTSDDDRMVLGSEKIEVVPNGVDCSVYRQNPATKDIDLIFTGNMGYYPNVQAVNHFCADILPGLRTRLGKVNFFIVGANPGREVRRWGNEPGVQVTGFVQDMVDYLNRAKVYVAPLLSGAGIQNKILEAMACSLPVVTTGFGDAAIRGSGTQSLLMRNSPESFRDAVVELLENEQLRQRIGARARRYVEGEFSWKKMADHVESMVREKCPGPSKILNR
ncbi:MAG: glycosyltransferase [Candidatus Geothermincolia bacterium]